MTLLHRLQALFYKELCQLLRAPKSRLILIVPPIMQMIILGYAATMDLKDVPFAVLDYSDSASSRELISSFVGSPVFRQRAPFRSESEMGDRINAREVKLALVIPPNFERAMAGYETPTVQILADGRNTTSAGLALGYAQEIISKFSANRVSEMSSNVPQISVSSRAWYNPTYDAQYYMVPAMLVMIGLLDVLLLTALAIAREREDGTMDQLLLTPYATWEILLGKAVSALFVGICQLSAGLLVALFWYRIPLTSSYGLLYAMLLSFVVAAIGIGMLISVLCQSLQQAMLGTLVIAIPCAMLSGLATPVESMPRFFQIITLANPMRHGISSVQQIFLESTTYASQLPALRILWTTALVSGALSWVIFEQQNRS